MTLPPSLERFQHDLERAVARDVRTRRRRRRRVLAGGRRHGGRRGRRRHPDRHRLERRRPVGLRRHAGPGPRARPRGARRGAGSIVHVRMEGFQDNGDGTTATWVNETWRSDGGAVRDALDRGRLRRRARRAGRERGADKQVRVYDATTNTIYVMPEAERDPQLKVGQVLHTNDDGTRVVVGPDGNKLVLEQGEPLPAGQRQGAEARERPTTAPTEEERSRTRTWPSCRHVLPEATRTRTAGCR